MIDRAAGRYVRRSEWEWRHVLARQRASGLSVSDFCQKHALSESNFYRWRTILEIDTSTPSTPTEAAFVDLGALKLAAPVAQRFELDVAIARIFTLRLVRH